MFKDKVLVEHFNRTKVTNALKKVCEYMVKISGNKKPVTDVMDTLCRGRAYIIPINMNNVCTSVSYTCSLH